MVRIQHKSDKNKTPALDDLLDELKAQDESLHRFTVPARELGLRDGRLVAGEHELELTEAHFADLCSAVNVPRGYLSRLGEPLSSYLLARHFKNGDHLETLEQRHLLGRNRRHAGNIAVVARDARFVGFARPDLQTLRAADVLDQIQAAARKQFKDILDIFIVRRFRCDATAFELIVSTPGVSHEVSVGDVIEGGLHVRHSLTGTHATQIEAYIHRIICANGAIKRECVDSRKGGSARIRRRGANRLDGPDESLRAVFEHTQRVLKGLSAKLQAVSKLRESKLHGESGVQRFVDTQLRQINRLHSRRLVTRVMEAWKAEEREETAYGAFNAITRTATHAPSSQLRPTVRRLLFHLGGVLGTSAEHLCPHCYRLQVN